MTRTVTKLHFSIGTGQHVYAVLMIGDSYLHDKGKPLNTALLPRTYKLVLTI